jgi:hypothetical protein
MPALKQADGVAGGLSLFKSAKARSKKEAWR